MNIIHALILDFNIYILRPYCHTYLTAASAVLLGDAITEAVTRI